MKILLKIMLLVSVLTACAPGSTEQPLFSNDNLGDPSYPNPSYPNPSYPNDNSPVPVDDNKPLSPVEEAVVKQLAGNLGLNADDISVVSNEAIEFSDSCMDVSMQEVMCAQVVTPGHVIVLEANGIQYEYHTDADGSRTVPATRALTWKREGGIAGFCDSLAVFLSGEIYGYQCNASDGRMETFANLLSVKEQNQFAAWIAEYGDVEVDASDPKGVADGMTVLLSFYGNGSAQPTEDDKSEIFLWAQDVYQRLYQ